MNISTYLVIILGIIFLLQLFIPSITDVFIFLPSIALSEPWRFISSVFLHGGFTHILFNCYALFMFGSILERRVNTKQYLFLFFSAGLVGSLFYYATYLLGMIPDIPALGASGAIYGILGAVAMLLPDLRIFFFFFPLRMRYAVIFWIALEFLGTFDPSSGIASAAHLGGILFGLAYGFYLKKGFGSDGWVQEQHSPNWS